MTYHEMIKKYDELEQNCIDLLFELHRMRVDHWEVINAQREFINFCGRHPNLFRAKDWSKALKYPSGLLYGMNQLYLKARIDQIEVFLQLWQEGRTHLSFYEIQQFKFCGMDAQDRELVNGLMPYERVRVVYSRRDAEAYLLQSSTGESFDIDLVFRDQCNAIVKAGPYEKGAYRITGSILNFTGGPYVYLGQGRVKLDSVWQVIEKFTYE